MNKGGLTRGTRALGDLTGQFYRPTIRVMPEPAISIGKVLGHYRILAQIGAGGMGVVYRARDERLDRDVALKVLPAGALADEAARKRFRKEALTLSRLSDPHIAIVHDFDTQEGMDFLVMEYAQGITLAEKIAGGALPESEVIAIGEQIAETLEHAHEAGIIHRDLKPANVMISAKAQIKLLDFGVAALLRLDEEDVTQSLASVNDLAGTLPYMAPERLHGRTANALSDVYSLGVVLYQLATRQLPFESKTSFAMVDEILHGQPTPPCRFQPRISHTLEEIILKCLAKDPEERYQSAAEVKVDLRRVLRDDAAVRATEPRSTAGSQRRTGSQRTRWTIVAVVIAAAAASWWIWNHETRPRAAHAGLTGVAVLPFQDLAGDTTSEYLRFALPDEVVGTLSYIPGLAVRPFSLTRKYADGNSDPQRVAQELRVDDVVTGHYLQESNSIRITLEVVEAGTSRLVWRETVNGNRQDLIALQREIDTGLRDELAPALGLGKTKPNAADQPKNQEAYELYLRGKAAGVDPVPTKQALRLLERSVELDPTFAPAWATLALRYYFDAAFSDGGAESARKSMESAQRALALDSNNVDAATFLASQYTENGDLNLGYDQAIALVRRRPDSESAHEVLAYVLRYAGLLDEAAGECDEARKLDPNATTLATCSVVYLYKGDYERARSYVRLRGDTDYANAVMTRILLREGKTQEALNGPLKKVPFDSAPYGRTILEACIGKHPRPEIDRAVAQRIKYAASIADAEIKYDVATEMAICGHRAEALQILRPVAARYCQTHLFETDPLLNSIRDDPQFTTIRAAAQACRQKFLQHRTEVGQ